MERHAFPLDEFSALDLPSSRSAPEVVPDEVLPPSLRTSEPPDGDEYPSDDLEVVFSRFIEERDVILVSEPPSSHDEQSCSIVAPQNGTRPVFRRA
jgi:hypothetical protein